VTDRPLAIVDSPFQLLSLFEALESGAVERPPDVVIRARAGSFERLLDLGQDVLASVVPGPLSLPACLRLLAGRRHLAVGDAYSGLFHAALGLRWTGVRRVVLLEDGASALRLHALLADGRPLTRAHSRRAAKSALAAFAGWRLRRLSRSGHVVLSTGLPMSPSVAGRLTDRGVDVRHHEFAWSRSVPLGAPIRAAERHGEVHVVLGSSLAFDRMLSWTYYRSWLADTAREGSLFVPHRREAAESRRIVERAGADTMADGALPVELLLRDVGPALHIDCLPTTAAITVPLVRGGHPTTVHCARPPESAWSRDEREMRRLVDAINAADLSEHEVS